MTLVALVVFGLGVAARAVPLIEARFLATKSARWIWEGRDRRDVSPTAFLAVRDFAVETVPARARVLVTADEEYVLFLNGQRVAAGSWERGTKLDVVEVGALLQPGHNRLVAELRSGRGAGGFLLRLEDGDGRLLAETGEDWRIFRIGHPGIVRGWLPLARALYDPPEIPTGEPAVSWGSPPTGIWGRPVAGAPVPVWSALQAGPPLPAAPPEGLVKKPPQVLFDWGESVAGYLTIAALPKKELQVGLLFTGDTPPDPQQDRPSGMVLLLPRQQEWQAARPGRFRYALVVGIASPTRASAQPVDAAVLPRLWPAVHPPEGVFGIAPPPLRTPVEDVVWGKFESVPGVAGSE
ncbi:MAG TPA: hypothetical protein DD490_19125 [Acidobacteria bacterium]|nr:hypothetical protein [Acidobacteriota bacterium]